MYVKCDLETSSKIVPVHVNKISLICIRFDVVRRGIFLITGRLFLTKCTAVIQQCFHRVKKLLPIQEYSVLKAWPSILYKKGRNWFFKLWWKKFFSFWEPGYKTQNFLANRPCHNTKLRLCRIRTYASKIAIGDNWWSIYRDCATPSQRKSF